VIFRIKYQFEVICPDSKYHYKKTDKCSSITCQFALDGTRLIGWQKVKKGFMFIGETSCHRGKHFIAE